MRVSNETGRAARAFATLICSVLLLAAWAVSAVAQPQTPRIASEVETKEKPPKEKEARTPAPPPRQQNTRRAPRAAAPIDVTFTTDLPQSEIFLNRGKTEMQLLGKTDAEGKL